MDIIYYPGTLAPSVNNVYRLKTGKYAKFADGNWYKSADTYRAAELERHLASVFSPSSRKFDHDHWCLVTFRRFTGKVQTDLQGSACEFEFVVPVAASEAEIAEEAREAAMNHIEWNYKEIPA